MNTEENTKPATTPRNLIFDIMLPHLAQIRDEVEGQATQAVSSAIDTHSLTTPSTTIRYLLTIILRLGVDSSRSDEIQATIEVEFDYSAARKDVWLNTPFNGMPLDTNTRFPTANHTAIGETFVPLFTTRTDVNVPATGKSVQQMALFSTRLAQVVVIVSQLEAEVQHRLESLTTNAGRDMWNKLLEETSTNQEKEVHLDTV